jgi:hypothetical protein
MTDTIDPPLTPQHHVSDQAAEIAELRAQLAELRNVVSEVSTASPEQSTSSRRGMLRLAGAAVAGAATTAVTARPAAAANGDSVIIGQNNSGTASTNLLSNTTNLAMLVWNTNTSGSGLQAIGGPYGIEGRSSTGTGVSGFSASGTAIEAESTSGTGIVAQAPAGTAVRAEGAVNGVLGISPRVGVTGSGGNGTGVFGEGFAYGVFSNGPFGMGPLPIVPVSGTFRVGDLILVVDTIYVCVSAAPNLRWRKVGGPAVAGGFHAITPYRAADTRRGTAAAPLVIGSDRILDINQAIDPATGAPGAVILPAGATAIAYNVTAVAPTGTGGFLSVVPGDATSFAVASVNWAAAGQTIGNASTVGISSGKVRVFSGGAPGQVNVVIDVVGYYA